MGKVFLAVSISLLSTGVFAADDRVKVTLTGCVNAGTTPDTFVLTKVEEVWPGKTIPAEAIYWLSSTKGLKEHVGHKVEVTGTYSPKRDEGKTGKLKIESDPDEGQVKVAVENGMKKAEIKEPVPVETSGVREKTEIKKPYRRLEVSSLRMIEGSCR